MRKQINEIKFDIFLIMTGVLTFLGHIDAIGSFLLPIFVVLWIVMVWKKFDIEYIISLAFFIGMSINLITEKVDTNIIYLSVFGIVITIDAFFNRRFTKLGQLFGPLVIFVVLSVLAFFNQVDLFTTFMGFIEMLAILGAYLYLLNTFKKGESTFRNVAKIAVYASLVVTAEMLYYILTSDLDVIVLIRTRAINIGWANINLIIYVNLIAIPLVAYLIVNSKFKIVYMMFALVIILGIFLTLSRSSIFTVGVYMLILIPTILILEKNRISLYLQGFVFTIIVFMFGYYLQQDLIVTDYFNTLLSRDLTDFESRWDLILVGIDLLKEYPLLGSGGVASSEYHLSEFGSSNYHNTIVQASTLGVFGILNLGYLFYKKIKLSLKTKDNFKYFAITMIVVTALVNGMFQPMYFYIVYMAYVFMVLASIEVNSE
ncbi:MAG: O-antigen ligase family protein [Candidatus Izemoplasma sp.]